VHNLVSPVATIAELAHGENRILNQSSPGLFDSPGTEAFASDQALFCQLRHVYVMSAVTA